MKVKKFEELMVWQKSKDLAVDVYHEFKHTKDFGFNDQIKRAVVSISNNIAEGFDRSSPADFNSRYIFMQRSEIDALSRAPVRLHSTGQKNCIM